MSYKAELDAVMKDDPRLGQHLHNLAHHPDVPDLAAARTFVVALGRWRAGRRSLYPCPPSAALGIEGVHRIDELVRRHVPFGKSMGAPAEPTPGARSLEEIREWLAEDDDEQEAHAA